VVYHALSQLEGESKITTTSGRQTLQEFICEYLFPRLRSRTDDYVEDGEDQDITDSCISQSFSYLQAVYTRLSHQPGHPWTYGSIDPCTLLYLLQDDPEVQLWDHTDLGFQHIPWIREPNMDCSLRDAMEAAKARIHICHKNGLYGILLLNRERLRTMGHRLEQTIRTMRIPLTHHPVPKEQDDRTFLTPALEQNEQLAHSLRISPSGNMVARVQMAEQSNSNGLNPRRVNGVDSPTLTRRTHRLSEDTNSHSTSDDELFDLAKRLQQRHLQLNSYSGLPFDAQTLKIPRRSSPQRPAEQAQKEKGKER
jgi:hypothetical protein